MNLLLYGKLGWISSGSEGGEVAWWPGGAAGGIPRLREDTAHDCTNWAPTSTWAPDSCARVRRPVPWFRARRWWLESTRALLPASLQGRGAHSQLGFWWSMEITPLDGKRLWNLRTPRGQRSEFNKQDNQPLDGTGQYAWALDLPLGCYKQEVLARGFKGWVSAVVRSSSSPGNILLKQRELMGSIIPFSESWLQLSGAPDLTSVSLWQTLHAAASSSSGGHLSAHMSPAQGHLGASQAP